MRWERARVSDTANLLRYGLKQGSSPTYFHGFTACPATYRHSFTASPATAASPPRQVCPPTHTHTTTTAGRRPGAHLAGRHHNVDHAEVLLQAVPHKHRAAVHQVAQLEVGVLEGGEVVRGAGRVQVARHQAAAGRAGGGALAAELASYAF